MSQSTSQQPQQPPLRVDSIQVIERVEREVVQEYGDEDVIYQVITFTDGSVIHMPPIEYTFKPNDELRIETLGGGPLDEGRSIERMSINDGPIIEIERIWLELLARLYSFDDHEWPAY